MKRAKRITIKDIAEHAGVSKSTVSLVLQNSPLIPEGTSEKVRKSIDALGYVYNRAAANLRTRRSHIVGVIISDIGNPFFSELVTSMENSLEPHGIVVMLTNIAENPERQRKAIATLMEHNVDGLFLSPARNATIDDLGPLKNSSIPAVFVNRYIPDYACNYVGGDNVLGTRMAVEYLLDQGHREIAFIGGDEGSSSRKERVQGYLDAFRKSGIEPPAGLNILTTGNRKGGYSGIRSLLDEGVRPTAAFCYNDVIALGVMLGLESRGIKPGGDFAVFGFDDISEAELWTPSLSTVAISPETLGKRAAALLLEKIENNSTNERILVSPRLMIRESSGDSL